MSSQEFTQYASEVMSNAKYNKAGKCINVEWFCKNAYDSWDTAGEPIWDWSAYYYRITPEPQYKPYEVAKVEWIGKIVKPINYDIYYAITGVDLKSKSAIHLGEELFSLVFMFDNYTWLDGSPFGERRNNNDWTGIEV